MRRLRHWDSIPTKCAARLAPSRTRVASRRMLTLLGLGTVLALLLLILFRLTSVLVALTLVPIAAALIGGFGGSLGSFAMDGIRDVTPVAALLAFAVIYFGVMNDAGLFDPV